MKLKLRGSIQVRGVNPYILIAKQQAIRLKPDWHKPMPVLVKVGNTPEATWHTNMMPDGAGNFYLYLHGDMRKVSGTKVGDVIVVQLEFDNDYKNGPLHQMPSWFSEALDMHKEARNNWDKLSPSRQKEILRYFAQLKSSEAQTRNLKQAMNALSGSPTRFMGRSWQQGS